MDAAVPWTPSTRPPGLGKPPSTRFPTAPTRIVAIGKKIQKSASHTKFLTLPSEQWIHESLVLGHAAVANVSHTYNEVAALSMNTHVEAIHAGFNAAWPRQKRDATSRAIHA